MFSFCQAVAFGVEAGPSCFKLFSLLLAYVVCARLVLRMPCLGLAGSCGVFEGCFKMVYWH